MNSSIQRFGQGFLRSGSYFYLVAFGVALMGTAESLQALAGLPPESPLGLWAVVAVAVGCSALSERVLQQNSWMQGGQDVGPVHVPSVVSAAVLAVSVAFVVGWGREDASLLDAVLRGAVGGLIAYFTILRPWRASFVSEYYVRHATVGALTEYVVEGLTLGGKWEIVSRTNDIIRRGEDIQSATGRYSELRYWNIEHRFSLHHRGAVAASEINQNELEKILS